MYFHEHTGFLKVTSMLSRELHIPAFLIEKDYWIMHCLYGLRKIGVNFEIKGGTSLSKGFELIHRFSEDIDIKIHPQSDLPIGKNQTSKAQVGKRRAFIDDIAHMIQIPGVTRVERDVSFDDKYMRQGGIRLHYDSDFEALPGVKTGILLELGFDITIPNRSCDISSWVMDRIIQQNGSEFIDNRATGIACFEPGYTFVEKLRAISTKFRQQQTSGEMPVNFMRHYYDVYCLLKSEEIQSFIGTPEYLAHKQLKFGKSEEIEIAKNPAFFVKDQRTRHLYEAAYTSTELLYYKEFPTFSEILDGIASNVNRL